MQQILIFIFKNKRFLLFLLLFAFGLILTVSSRAYHNAQFWHSANWVSGSLHQIQNTIGDYFKLKKDNEQLLQHNAILKAEQLRPNKTEVNLTQLQFSIINGIVIKNSYNLSHNYLTLNVGEKNGVSEDVGVISDQGIVGIVDRVNSKFSRVQSILNRKSKISVQVKNTNHLGIMTWDGIDPHVTLLSDVPSLAKISINDTIITSGNSLAFPKGLIVGVIKAFNLDESQNYYTIQVALINDMTSLNNVYVIRNQDAQEINALNSTDE